MDDFQLAYAHYCLQFPDLASLGTGDPPVAWKAEYDRLVASGLSAVLITSNSQGGDGTGAIRNFDQRLLLTALHRRRQKLDATYTAPSELPPRDGGQPHGHILRFGP